MASKFPRVLSSVLLIVAAALVAFPLTQYFFPRVQTLSATVGDAQIQIGTDRIAADSEGCLMAEWSIEGVEAVYVHTLLQAPQPTVGESQQRLCTDRDMYWVWTVSLLDGSTERYRLPVIVSTARIWGLYALLSVGLLAGAALLWVPPAYGAVMRFWGRIFSAQSTRFGWQDGSLLVILAGLCWLIYEPAKFNVYGGDYEAHLYYAYSIQSWADIKTPHFLFHLLTIALARWMPATELEAYREAAHVLTLVSHTLTVWGTYAFLRGIIGGGNRLSGHIAYAGLAFMLPLMAQISLVGIPTYDLFHGYLPSINLFHNPTTTLLKPFVIFYYGLLLVLMFTPSPPRARMMIVLIAVLAAVSLFAKPSFTIILLPPLGIWGVWVFLRTRRIRWDVLIAVFLPSVPVLLWQFLATFSANGEPVEVIYGPEVTNSQVIFAPLAVMLTREPQLWLLGIKFLFSVAFPLGLLTTHWQYAKRSAPLMFTWALFGVGALYTYLLAEAGVRLSHGNFTWSGHIGLWLLYTVSAALFIRWGIDGKLSTRWRDVVGALFALHIVSGGVWHMVNVASGYGFFWW